MIRVAVDARTVFSPHRRGTGKNLIDLYDTLSSRKPDWEFIMFSQNPTGDEPFGRRSNIRTVKIDIPGDRWNLWQDVRLPIAAWREGASVLHLPANTAPRFSLIPTVVTVHDLIPLEIEPDEPSTVTWLRRVRVGARRARRVITPSEYSRGAIVRHLGVRSEKVTVNVWAPDRNCRRVESAEQVLEVRSKYGIPADRDYVLAFGAADPRKNTRRMIEAWSRVPARVRSGALLLFVGIQASALEAFEQEVARLVDDGSCRLHGFAEEADIPALLTGASALCYPSLSEGFGLPLLDAFACGTPTITSNSTSLPEVAGDAALLVDPHDVDSITTALVQILTSAETRSRLSEAGKKRLSEFSWEKCADTVASVLEAAAYGR